MIRKKNLNNYLLLNICVKTEKNDKFFQIFSGFVKRASLMKIWTTLKEMIMNVRAF